MRSIINTFSEHGTFVQPETLEYILSKDDPKKFASFLKNNLKEYPLVLTLDQIKNIEQTSEIEKIPIIPEDTMEKKKIQGKMLTKLFDIDLKPETSIDENEIKYGEINKKDEIEILKPETNEKSMLFLKEIKKVKGWKPKAREYDAEIRIIKDVTGKSTCEGTTKDFVKLFVDRYDFLRKLLRNQRREMANVIPIDRINKGGIKEIQIVGIVSEVRTTQNGHKLIEIEDETGSFTSISLKSNRETFQMANEVVLDEVVGIIGYLSKNGDILVIQNIIFPDVSIQNERYKTNVPICAAFLSDIHIGSKEFMEKQWQAFIRWINGEIGNSRQSDIASKIKYLVIPGDVVDGIGIYPDQDKELAITDLYSQYEALADQLQLIPDHISIIMQPGNHDAVRPAEPQPTFDKEIQNLFSSKDITFIGNPCYFSLNKVEILSYHGQSLLDFATNIQHLKYNEPVEIMKVMLKKHHLAPSYGGYTPLAPEHSDYMVIDKVPDIFVTGHVHLAMIGEYRGVTMINASCWQAQTSYQKMLNFIPDPAKLPIANLKTGNITMMDFSKKSF